MILVERKQGLKEIVEIKGKIDATAASGLDQTLQKAIRGGLVNEIILDFSQVTFVASMGLRAILRAQKLLNEKKGKLNIINISEAVRDVFALTNMIDRFVQDEKLVIIQKTKTLVELSLAGHLDDETLSILMDCIEKLEKEGVVDLHLDCGGLNAVSGDVVQNIEKTRQWLISKNGSLILQNAPASLKSLVV
ncbi:hypothetical protein FACS189498_1190 [Spirochaetia bacterium]|nr:hypothetical protein FACS189498_1190 [Spirochaetia bacterium]